MEMLTKGHHFVLASGRPVKSILDVLEKLDIKESAKSSIGRIYATSYNGAVIYDCISDTCIETYDIPIPTAQKIFDLATAKGIHIQTYTDTHIVSCADDREIAYYTKTVKLPYLVETKLDKVLSHAPFKLIAIALEDTARLSRVGSIRAGTGDCVCIFASAVSRNLQQESGKGKCVKESLQGIARAYKERRGSRG